MHAKLVAWAHALVGHLTVLLFNLALLFDLDATCAGVLLWDIPH
jgi:hypothetical protein